jgi:hypothetical protein
MWSHRHARVQIGGHADMKGIAVISQKGGPSTQALGEEAINLLFQSRRLNRSA